MPYISHSTLLRQEINHPYGTRLWAQAYNFQSFHLACRWSSTYGEIAVKKLYWLHARCALRTEWWLIKSLYFFNFFITLLLWSSKGFRLERAPRNVVGEKIGKSEIRNIIIGDIFHEHILRMIFWRGAMKINWKSEITTTSALPMCVCFLFPTAETAVGSIFHEKK